MTYVHRWGEAFCGPRQQSRFAAPGRFLRRSSHAAVHQRERSQDGTDSWEHSWGRKGACGRGRKLVSPTLPGLGPFETGDRSRLARPNWSNLKSKIQYSKSSKYRFLTGGPWRANLCSPCWAYRSWSHLPRQYRSERVRSCRSLEHLQRDHLSYWAETLCVARTRG